MEVDEDIDSPRQPAPKYSRVSSNGSRKLGLSSSGGGETGLETMNGGGGGGDVVASTGFGRQWQNSSRIIRVSRASGGKDRHSKVWTAKGARDRRVRLSVNTAIQFYDLQDRLGYDQPSKAVEWLIKAAAESINELPSLNNANFPPEGGTGLRHLTSNQRSAELELELEQEQQVGSVSKSGCSSNNSETSKGSGLSLSRNEIRVKARERARERTAKEKESTQSNSSFTQLLTAGINNNNNSLKDGNAAAGPTSTPSPHRVGSGGGGGGGARAKNEDGLSTLQWTSSSSCTIPMADYFGMSLLPFSGSHGIQQHQHQQQQQQLPFLSDNGVGSEYNLNFSMSSSSTTSGLAAAGFNRGTLQSNSASSSPSFLSYLQRFSTTDGGSSVPFFLGGAQISPIVENQQHQQQHYHHDQHHQFNPAGLHLCYGNGSRHSEDKGKGKN